MKYAGIGLIGLALMFMAFIDSAEAETCGQVACRNITGEQSVREIESLLHSVGSDCKSVNEVRLLDKSKPGIMHIYEVKCDDGHGDQTYQIIHWASQREFNIDKLSGKWMDAIRFNY